MIKGIEELYQTIADSIQESITEDWESAKMEAVFFQNASQYCGEYTRLVDGIARDFPTLYEGERAFREIRSKFIEAGQHPWGRACFHLDSNGKFKMDWSYDECDEDGYALFDEDEELRRSEERHRRLTN